MDHSGGRSDLEASSAVEAVIPQSYAPLPGGADDDGGSQYLHLDVGSSQSCWKSRALTLLASVILLVTLGAVLSSIAPVDPSAARYSPGYLDPHQQRTGPEAEPTSKAEVVPPVSVGRGVREGVSDKSSGAPSGRVGAVSNGISTASWSNEAFQWQRSAFHFQPEKNWMNDPNGPLFYKGWYHLFYQYNPHSAVWGNITWGHAVSRDLVHWFHLPLAMVPDQWYDANGVFSGSATLLPDGRVVILFTGSTDTMAQVQNLAYPEDPSDPLLLRWAKSPSNPVLYAPPGIGEKDFRDPTTAWYDPADESWRVAVGSKDAAHAGIGLVYRTKDFLSYDLLPGYLHAVPGTGMWECIDFYPVSTDGRAEGLDTSVTSGPGVKHVLKASLDDDKHDYYAVGTYDPAAGTWTPDAPEADVGIGLRYDYGKFYASKTFYDGGRRRRVLWGWIGETDSEGADISKGWASLQSVPRTVRLDEKTQGANLVQWPVEEIDNLRTSSKRFAEVKVVPGETVPLDIGFEATQLDISVEFEIAKDEAEAVLEANVGFNCSSSGGAAQRGALGPFGLLVLADEARSEQTAVYFYVAREIDGNLGTFVCQDDLRSSHADDIVKRVYGSTVPVLDGEKLSLRILVDHSIVETFAQGGRTCITSRVYPTTAIYGAARVFLFNNATAAAVTATSVQIWQMNSARTRFRERVDPPTRLAIVSSLCNTR